jgi:hypothetical protein
MYHDWISTMLTHRDDFPGMTSVGYLASRYIPNWPSWGDTVTAFLLIAAATFFILLNMRREDSGTDKGFPEADRAFEWFLLAGLLPNLIRTDWVLLVFTAPLILYIIYRIAQDRQWRLIPVFVFIVFFYGANSDDLLGRELSRTILHSGLMGLANFLLVTMAFILFTRSRRESLPPSG